MNWKKKSAIILILFITGLWLLSINAGSRPEKIEYGATFSKAQAQALGLNWQEAYVQMLEDLKIKHLRLSAYWNEIEPNPGELNFTDLDFMVSRAAENNVSVVLSVGKKLPRWPECHEPGWAKELPSYADRENALLSYLENTVRHYYLNPSIKIWQIENEPFLDFGECSESQITTLDKEIALVKKLDPVRPVLITDSGEINLWLKAGAKGDMFGTTLYRFVFSDVFDRYWVNYIPYWFYRVKGGLLRVLYPNKKIVIIELQAEPWTTNGILSTPVEEQFKTMSLEKFESILGVARATQYSPQFLWGAEWWYWMKTTQGHPEFWETVKRLNQ